MRRRSLAFGDQRISRFLHAVVEEFVATLQKEQEPRLHGLIEFGFDRRR